MRASLGLLMVIAATSPAAGQDASGGAPQTTGPNIIVTPPPTEAERHRELRDFTREVIHPPRINQPLAKFAYPVCVQVLGLAPDDGTVIAERIRENARVLGVGADPKPGCVPTVRVAFMSPAAGPATCWLTANAPQLAHLASYQRERVLAETGPVRAWNKVAVRDSYGQPIQLGETSLIDPQPLSRTDALITTEITGAAVLIARDAAEGFTLGQLADYATMRTLIDTGAPDGVPPAPTILTLFNDPEPPAELTAFDEALVRELYDASRNAKPRRVYNDIARAAVAAERAAER